MVDSGGGWRFLGRVQGKANRHLDGGRARSRHHQPLMRHGFIHVVLDHHGRLAYAEIHDAELGVTASAVIRRAVAWFADRGVTTRRPLTDNGGCYRSRTWRAACTELDITHKRTRPYRPQTNGKAERFNRTMTNEWAFAHLFTSDELEVAVVGDEIELESELKRSISGRPPSKRRRTSPRPTISKRTNPGRKSLKNTSPKKISPK